MTTLKTILPPHQRGLLYKDGKLVQWLEPGKHSFWSLWAEQRIEVIDLEQGYMKSTPELRAIIPEDAGYEVVIAAHELGIITIDGVARACVQPGRYILWQLRAKVDVVVYDTRQLVVELPDDHAAYMPAREVESFAIASNQRGALYVDKKPALWLEPGTYRVFKRNRTLNLYYLDVNQGTYALDPMPELVEVVPKGAAEPLEVSDNEFALVYRDGRVIQCLQAGAYLLWNIRHRITAKVYSMNEIFSTVPEKEWAYVPTHLLSVKVVRPYEQGLLWVDGQFIGQYDEGRYGIHVKNRQVEFSVVDMREQELQIQGQEVMTRDKVTLRLNLIVKYRIEDALQSVQSSTALATALYSEAQLVARSYVASISVDELLESRDEAGSTMLHNLFERGRGWGVEVLRLDIKDLVLPGEMKTLLNRVIEAEKQAAANVIMRREETAAMRAQANTAKMMENNPALLRMRELEMMREIATNVGNITVVAGGEQVVKWARGDS